MRPITFLELRRAVGGKCVVPIPDNAPQIFSVCTNSKQIEKSSLFIALRGERFDAHQFLPDVLAGGALAALVDHVPENAPAGLHLIIVPDTRIAMGKLAKFVRKQFRGKVIAVAGSNGKTSTKYLIGACLKGRLRGSISPKSFNNDIGIPLAIFPADPAQDYLVLEMGTNHHGEIRMLTNMATPDIAVITNCGPEHLEFLGDLAGVRKENATLIEGLNPKGLLIVNGDDPELLAAVAAYPGQRITFGFDPTNDIYATNIQCDANGTRFCINGRSTQAFVPMLGRHAAANALAAIAVGRKMGLTEVEILENLSHATGPEMRLQMQDFGGVSVLNDAYNANPASMKAALQTLSSLPTGGKRIAILGDMRELGHASDASHLEIGNYAAQMKPDRLICVGASARLIADGAKAGGLSSTVIEQYADAAGAVAVAATVRSGDLVLLKASRAIRLETVAAAIERLASLPLKAAS